MQADIWDRLDASDSLDAVGKLFAEAVATFGFTASAAGAFLQTVSGPGHHFFFQNWPPAWIELYAERNFVAVDYSVAEARRRLAPFTWREAEAERTLSREERALWDTANQWGWPDGISVPIHGPGGYFALIAMAGETRHLDREARRELHLLSLAVHDRCRQLTRLSPVGEPIARLSPRELECLRWVAAGKTDWEIGKIIGLSQTTVKTHVDQGRRKLAAKSRPQAVARMVLFGLA